MKNNDLTKQEKLNNMAYLLRLLSSAIKQTFPPKPDEDTDFGFIYGFAKMHKVANTAFYAVEQLEEKPQKDLFKKWQDERNRDVHKNIVQTMEHQSITSEFKKQGIEYLPIKGLPLCNLYPKPEYRNMSDLDILIKSDLKKAGKIVQSMGYDVIQAGGFHHDEYSKPPFMILELHRDIIRVNTPFYKYYENIFDRCKRIDDCEYRMSDEDFYIFNLVHLYKHYSGSGCGIRMIMDMYLLNKKLEPQLDKEYLDKNLKQLGLTDFHDMISNIAEKWFGRVDVTEFSVEEMYILTSGAYGTDQNKFAHNHKGKNDSQYVLMRLFPPVIEMKNSFPVLRKYPLFLPVFYVIRLAKAPFTKRQKIKNEVNYMKNKKKNKAK